MRKLRQLAVSACRTTALLVLGVAALTLPARANSCKVQSVFGPYTISKGAPPRNVYATTFQVFNSRGQLIAVYTFTNLQNGDFQIKLNNQPYTFNPERNPLGLYTREDAEMLAASICPDSESDYRAQHVAAASTASSANPSLPTSNQAASQYVSADFNNDGVPDNATAGAGFVQVTLYNAQTGALTPTNYNIGGEYPGVIVAGDFNGDSIPDLAVTILTNSPPGSVAVLLGKGDGTFSVPVNYNAGPAPLSIAATDLNGDGKTDLVITNQNASGFPSGTVAVLLGKGDGTFAAPVSYNAGKIPVSVIATDLKATGGRTSPFWMPKDRTPSINS